MFCESSCTIVICIVLKQLALGWRQQHFADYENLSLRDFVRRKLPSWLGIFVDWILFPRIFLMGWWSIRCLDWFSWWFVRRYGMNWLMGLDDVILMKVDHIHSDPVEECAEQSGKQTRRWTLLGFFVYWILSLNHLLDSSQVLLSPKDRQIFWVRMVKRFSFCLW